MNFSISNRQKAFAILFKELYRWDVKFFASRLTARFPFVPLGNFINERTERVTLFKYPDQTFTILGVNNISGVFHAYDTKGKSIHQSYKRVYAEDFFYNPYRVNVGSIGTVPQELDGNFTSPAYVVFYANKSKIIPKFLELVMRSDWYNSTLRAATAGSVRQNLTINLLKNLEIPLPPLQTQQEIVTEWEKAQAEIANIHKRSDELEEGIEIEFLDNLGLAKPKLERTLKAFSVLWADIERWSVSFSHLASININIEKSHYNIACLRDIILFTQYGSSKKANTLGKGIPIIRMNNIIKGVLNFDDLKYIVLNDREIKSLLLQDGDILFNRTNSKELVGKCAVFHEKDEYVFASYLIRLKVDSLKALPDFVVFTLNSVIGRQQINMLSRRIGGQANINSGELFSIKIPIPPLDIQKKLINKVITQRAGIAKLKEEAKRREEEAKAYLEDIILGQRHVEGS